MLTTRTAVLAIYQYWLQSRVRPMWHFILVGAVNTGGTYAIYVIADQFVRFEIAYTISFACGVLFSLVATSGFVFRVRLRWRSMIAYPTFYVLSYLVGLRLVVVLVMHWHINEAIAPLLVLFVMIPLNYLVARFIFLQMN